MKNTSHKKIIPYEFIINLEKDIETFDSLEEYFHSLLDYFNLAENPGVQENVGNYYFNQLLLVDFYQEYRALSEKFREELSVLKNAQVIQPECQKQILYSKKDPKK